jgi:4-amino-4-deoxy-L-arabinose transferase-like glycosyltransferase
MMKAQATNGPASLGRKGPLARLTAALQRWNWDAILFALILALGVFARTWEFGSVPPGLNQDEASDGVDALSLLRYGTDRAGVSYPMRFIGWGSGQDALYGYLLVPLVAAAGLSPRVVRLPMLVAGLVTLPLFYVLARKLRGKSFGLLAMFLLAISPWHVVLSRWGLDSNLLPLMFLLGFTCLLGSDRGNHWFIAACVCFGLALYAYISSYLSVPLFLILAAPATFRAGRISRKALAAGLVILLFLATPAILYVIINTWGVSSIRIGPLTIPHLPSASRIQTDVALFQVGPAQQVLRGALRFLGLVVAQTDGEYDQPGFGYLYKVTIPIIIAGGWLYFSKAPDRTQRWLVAAWLVAAASVGVVTSPDFHHNNVLFPLLIIFGAVFLDWLRGLNKTVFALSLAAFLAAFAWFTAYYHGAAYKEQADREYFTGLLSALNYAKSSSGGPICVTTPKIIMPYVFSLFAEQMSPSVSPDKIVYAEPDAQFRHVASVGRYYFGPENCPAGIGVTYVAFFNEPPPFPRSQLTMRQFGTFKVYLSR